MDEGKVQRFAQRVVGRARGADKSAYISIRIGTNYRSGADSIASLDDVGELEAGDVVAWAREVLADAEGDGAPKAYLDARWVGGRTRFDHTWTPLESGGEDDAPAGGGDLAVALRVVERMARNADARANRADFDNGQTLARVLRYAERAHQAEAHAQHQDVMLMAELAEGDRKTAALETVAPVVRAMAAKMLGMPPALVAMMAAGKELDAGAAAKLLTTSKRAPAGDDDDAEAKRKALQALRALRRLRQQHPSLGEDEEVVASMGALIVGEEPAAEPAAEEPAAGAPEPGAPL